MLFRAEAGHHANLEQFGDSEMEVMKGLEREDGVDVALGHGPYQGAFLDEGFVVCQRCTGECLHG